MLSPSLKSQDDKFNFNSSYDVSKLSPMTDISGNPLYLNFNNTLGFNKTLNLYDYKCIDNPSDYKDLYNFMWSNKLPPFSNFGTTYFNSISKLVNISKFKDNINNVNNIPYTTMGNPHQVNITNKKEVVHGFLMTKYLV